MKWITHQTGALLAAAAMRLPAAGIAAAAAGAILPDVIDQRLTSLGRTKRQRQKIFNRIHRGSSHWFGWWLALFLVSLAAPLPETAKVAAAGLAFGALSHVFLDMLTTQGVPWRPFSRQGRVSLHLCSTGSLGEYVFLALMVAAGAWFLGGDALPALMKTLSLH